MEHKSEHWLTKQMVARILESVKAALNWWQNAKAQILNANQDTSPYILPVREQQETNEW